MPAEILLNPNPEYHRKTGALRKFTQAFNQKWPLYEYRPQPDTPTVRFLKPSEIAKFSPRKKEIKIAPGLGESSDLKELGFDLVLQMRRFFENPNYYSLDADIRSFTIEFIKGGSVFPHLIAKENSFVVNSFDHQRIVPKISPLERYGANVEASVKMEEFFAEPEELDGAKRARRMAILNSPPGWNGIVADYADSQTLIQWEDENGDLKGLTLRADLTVEQARQLSINLGTNPNDLTGNNRKELIANIVRNPILIEIGSNRFNSAEDIAKELLSIRGWQDIEIEQLDGTKMKIPVQNMLRDMKRRHQLLKFSEAVEKHLDDLKTFILDKAENYDDFSIQEEIASKTEEIIYEITGSIMGEKGLKKTPELNNSQFFVGHTTSNTHIESSKRDFSAEKAFLATRVGCSRGLRNSLSVFSSSGLESLLENSFESSSSIGGGETALCQKCNINPASKGPCGYFCESCQHNA